MKETGIFENIPFKDYQDWPGMNASSLKGYNGSLKHWRHLIDNGIGDTPALRLGRAIHSIVLEGRAQFDKEFAITPSDIDRRTKAGKEAYATFLESAKDKSVLSPDEAETARNVADAVIQSPLGQDIFIDNGRAELSIQWNDPDTGLLCKARIDWAASNALVDLKTAADASPKAFLKDIVNYGYHQQAAHYANGWRVLTGDLLPFQFLAVEKSEPFGVALYELSDEFMSMGHEKNVYLMRKYQEAEELGLWSESYQQEPVELEPPAWFLRQNEELIV